MKSYTLYKSVIVRLSLLIILSCSKFSADAQTVSIEGTSLKITFPGNNWTGQKMDFGNIEGFESIAGDFVTTVYSKENSSSSGQAVIGKNNVSITIEKKPVNISVSSYAAGKNRLSGFTILKTYTTHTANSPVPELAGIIVQKVIQEIPFMTGTIKGYNAFIVN